MRCGEGRAGRLVAGELSSQEEDEAEYEDPETGIAAEPPRGGD
eukprot:SAG11_NODE_443_length_9422_cov_4.441382_2_plen_43_part_00